MKKIGSNWSMGETLSVPFGPAGRNVERGLQVATGALFISLLTLLGSSWSDPTDPKFALQVATIRSLGIIGTAFCAAMIMTQGRVMGGKTILSSFLWWACVVTTVGLLFYGSYSLLENLKTATQHSIDVANHQPTDIRKELGEINSQLKQIEEKIGMGAAEESKKP